MLTWTAHNGNDPNNAGDPYRKRMEELPLLRYCVLVARGLYRIFPGCYRDIYVDADVRKGDVRYEDSPIQKDWGTTLWDFELFLDAEFTAQFEGNAPSSRKSWSTTSFFDMSLSFMKDNVLDVDIFTASNIRGTIWNDKLCAEDIAPLMKNAALWSRHTFPQAEKVALLTGKNVKRKCASPTNSTRSSSAASGSSKAAKKRPARCCQTGDSLFLARLGLL